jgi:dolichol-phosphate mannosyltransferase
MNNNFRPHISIVTPVYKSVEFIEELYLRLSITLKRINDNYEIIFVNDGSPDNSWEIICQLAGRDKKVKGINLSRNFGQHYAITAGIKYAKGDWCVVMDCDLQDQPEEIPKLYSKTFEGFDVVFGRRQIRKDHFLKKILSWIFYKTFDYLANSDTDNTVANFGIYSRQIVDNLQLFSEQSRVLQLNVKWLGFNIGYVNIEHDKRFSGKSSYTLRKLLNLALDVLISQSNKPLRLSIAFGFIIAFLAFIYGIILITNKILYDVPIGYTSIMVGMFFIGGLLFINLGLLGLYVGKIYNETKKRPIYLIKDKVGF